MKEFLVAKDDDSQTDEAQCVLVPRKIGELELEFEIPTWNSNWDFEEFTVKFTVRFTINFVINN